MGMFAEFFERKGLRTPFGETRDTTTFNRRTVVVAVSPARYGGAQAEVYGIKEIEDGPPVRVIIRRGWWQPFDRRARTASKLKTAKHDAANLAWPEPRRGQIA